MEVTAGDWVYSVNRNSDGSFSGERWPIDDKNNKEQLTRLEELPLVVHNLLFGKNSKEPKNDERVDDSKQMIWDPSSKRLIPIK